MQFAFPAFSLLSHLLSLRLLGTEKRTHAIPEAIAPKTKKTIVPEATMLSGILHRDGDNAPREGGCWSLYAQDPPTGTGTVRIEIQLLDLVVLPHLPVGMSYWICLCTS